GSGTVVLQYASMSFDAAVSEWTTALLRGGRLVLLRGEQVLPGKELVELLRREAVEVVTLPPSVLGALEVAALPALRTLVVAGEACAAELVARWGRGRQMLNAYGPTEATVCATVSGALEAGEVVGIGRALGGAQVYVVDEWQGLAPLGGGGGMGGGGAGVGRGGVGRGGQ